MFLDKAKLSTFSWRTILYIVFVCITWTNGPQNTRKIHKSMFVEKKSIDCHVIKKKFSLKGGATLQLCWTSKTNPWTLTSFFK